MICKPECNPWYPARAVGVKREIVNKYAEGMVRSVRETGTLIDELPRQPGKRTDKEPGATDFGRFLTEAAISERTAQNWQAVAAI